MSDARKVSLYTLGCRLNQAETALIAERFRERGYEVAEHGEPVWTAIEARMMALLQPALDLMIEALSRYETLPFGLTIDEFVSYASTQFQYRYARIAKARTQSHAEMANEHLSALEAH